MELIQENLNLGNINAIYSITTARTMNFVRPFLSQQKSKILEVGCGLGHVSKELRSLGHDVIAIDSSQEAVNRAKQIGHNHVVHQDFFTMEEKSFDLILFTRSLHHMAPLQSAMDKVNRMLNKNGYIAVEDFDYLKPTLDDLTWYYGLWEMNKGLLEVIDHKKLCEDDYLDQWLNHHCEDHEIHSGSKIKKSVLDIFQMQFLEHCPYFYRYFQSHLKNHPNGKGVLKNILDWELSLIGSEKLNPIGINLVAKKN